MKRWHSLPVTYTEITKIEIPASTEPVYQVGDTVEYRTFTFRAGSRGAAKATRFIKEFSRLRYPGSPQCLTDLSFHGMGRDDADEFVRAFMAEAPALGIASVSFS